MYVITFFVILHLFILLKTRLCSLKLLTTKQCMKHKMSNCTKKQFSKEKTQCVFKLRNEDLHYKRNTNKKMLLKVENNIFR